MNPLGQTLYTLIAYGSSGEATATVILDVENENLSPIARAWAQYAVVGQVGDTSGFAVLHGEGSSDADGDPAALDFAIPIVTADYNTAAVLPVQFRYDIVDEGTTIRSDWRVLVGGQTRAAEIGTVSTIENVAGGMNALNIT